MNYVYCLFDQSNGFDRLAYVFDNLQAALDYKNDQNKKMLIVKTPLRTLYDGKKVI